MHGPVFNPSLSNTLVPQFSAAFIIEPGPLLAKGIPSSRGTGRSDAEARRTRSFAFDLRGWHAEIRIKLGFDPAIITGSAEIVRDFIGNFHEKSEEEAVILRFRKVEKMVPPVKLDAEH